MAQFLKNNCKKYDQNRTRFFLYWKTVIYEFIHPMQLQAQICDVTVQYEKGSQTQMGFQITVLYYTFFIIDFQKKDFLNVSKYHINFIRLIIFSQQTHYCIIFLHVCTRFLCSLSYHTENLILISYLIPKKFNEKKKLKFLNVQCFTNVMAANNILALCPTSLF